MTAPEPVGLTDGEWCREELPTGERCPERAEFILWGKLTDPTGLGPRCYPHAVNHTHWSMPSRVDQWAVFDLRPLAAERAHEAQVQAGDQLREAIEALADDWEAAAALPYSMSSTWRMGFQGRAQELRRLLAATAPTPPQDAATEGGR